MDQVRLQSIGAGVLVSFAVLGVLLLYGLIPGHGPVDRLPYYALFSVAFLTTAGLLVAPWGHIVQRRLLVPVLYVWATLDIALVSAGISLTGGSHSDLYLVYLVLCVFQASVSFPRRARTVLGLALAVAYLATLAATGWSIGTATLVLRLGMIMATAAGADVLATKLTQELRFRSEVAADFEHRAELWSRVAGLGRAVESLDEDAMLAWAVEAVSHLGFEAAVVAMFGSSGDTYRPLHPRGLPASYGNGGLRPTDKGLTGRVRLDRRTVVLNGYAALPDMLPEIQQEGIHTVVGTPVWVEGMMAAVLIGGTRADRLVSSEELAAFELLAAHVGTGIAHARRLERQRVDAARFRPLLESVSEAMLVLDGDLRVLDANSQVRPIFGCGPDELRGMALDELLAPEAATFVGELRRSLADHPSSPVHASDTEVLALHRDGTVRPVEMVVGPLEVPDGVAITATVRDVSERREFERRLAHQASHDPLTGLPNRNLFVDQLADRLEHAPTGVGSVAVCFLDIDHFKYVNDSRGHAVGDDLVVEVARRISETARSADLVARFGGDEFAVLIDGLSHRQGAVAYAWRLLAAFERPFVVQGAECYVTASAGLSFGGQGDDPLDMLRDADAAMYHLSLIHISEPTRP